MKVAFKVGQALAGRKSDRFNTTTKDLNFYIWVPLKIRSWVSVARFTYHSKKNYWWDVAMLDHSIDYEPLIEPDAAHNSIIALFRDGIEGLEK